MHGPETAKNQGPTHRRVVAVLRTIQASPMLLASRAEAGAQRRYLGSAALPEGLPESRARHDKLHGMLYGCTAKSHM